MCKVFEVSRSGYYKWLKVKKDKSTKLDQIDERIKKSFTDSNQSYGSPRIALDINKEEYVCSESTIARRMKVLRIAARKKAKFINTTDSNHGFAIKPNLLDRNFESDRIGKVWVSDITYIWVKDYWMYLTTVIDLADRMVVGWSLSDNMTAESTVISAFKNAIAYRIPEVNFIFHSDRGVQYACNEFCELIQLMDGRQSMSRKGNCWDNAVAESFFKTIKVECIYHNKIMNAQHAYSIIFNYISGWYNTKRIHSSRSREMR